ncbi:hypothetical protein DRO58_04015 [Candidatus Bathyarchaeota archaeon]|nr:MAG: hypothetical protein DRO58_04015 [Candidatus Bathyarchaeota archaeon]
MGKSYVEYATDQITVYPPPCPYKCAYCFWGSPLWKARARRIKPKPLKEAERYVRLREHRIIVVSFTTDPYPPWKEVYTLTRQVLKILSEARQHKIMILTKNPSIALRDLDIMKTHGNMWLGTTITQWKWVDRLKLEPKAPSPFMRSQALKWAHERGVKTWLSIEPIHKASNPLAILENTIDHVDFYVFGKLNYAKTLGLEEPTPGEYREKLEPALKLLDSLGKPYLVKKELKQVLEAGEP